MGIFVMGGCFSVYQGVQALRSTSAEPSGGYLIAVLVLTAAGLMEGTSLTRALWQDQTPAALRRTGRKRLEAWLRNRKVRGSEPLAQAALDAAERQQTALPGERITAQVIHTLAKEVMGLNEQLAEIDQLIAARFREHELAEVIESMPGIGPLMGAEFLAATAGDMSRYGSADRLASMAGVAPTPRDSGSVSATCTGRGATIAASSVSSISSIPPR